MKNLWLAGAFIVIFAGSLHALADAPAQESVAPQSPATVISTPDSAGLAPAGSIIAVEDDSIRLTPDETRTISLDRDISSIIVTNPEHAVVVMDNPRTLIVMPRQPGATSFTAIDSSGRTLMERKIIVTSTAKPKYVRIRKVCDNRGGMTQNFSGGGNCEDSSYYYCPDGCYEVKPVDGSNGVPNGPPILPSAPEAEQAAATSPQPTPAAATTPATLDETTGDKPRDASGNLVDEDEEEPENIIKDEDVENMIETQKTLDTLKSNGEPESR